MTIDEILRNKILYIGNELPDSFTKDNRSKQVYLGSPAELIKEIKEAIILPKRFPRAGDSDGELMCAGFNQYREMLVKLFEE